MLNDLVGHLLDVALHLRIFEFPADEAFSGEEGVLGVDDGLTLRSDTN
jgi:hypothetical protein